MNFNPTPFFFQDRAVNELGIGKEDAKYLLSIVGIANTIGRVVLGFIADRPWVNRLYLYNTSLAICGLCKYLMLIQSSDFLRRPQKYGPSLTFYLTLLLSFVK